MGIVRASHDSCNNALKQRRPRMSDVWYARQIATQAVAAGCHAETIRKHMTGRPSGAGGVGLRT